MPGLRSSSRLRSNTKENVSPCAESSALRKSFTHSKMSLADKSAESEAEYSNAVSTSRPNINARYDIPETRFDSATNGQHVEDSSQTNGQHVEDSSQTNGRIPQSLTGSGSADMPRGEDTYGGADLNEVKTEDMNQETANKLPRRLNKGAKAAMESKQANPNSLEYKINKELEEEDGKLHQQNVEAAEREKEQFIKDLNDEEAELKEERYRKLQLLLAKSELYSKYLLERIEFQQEQIPSQNSTQEPEEPPQGGIKRKHEDQTEDNTSASTTSDLEKPQSQMSLVSQANSALSSGCPLLFTGSLRPYQKKGLIWLNTMFENGVNGILADEMGLGKTVQCVASIAHLITMGVTGPYLIVVPLSTLPNWINEFKRFAPKVPTVLYHGTKPEREQLRKELRRKHVIDDIWMTYPVVCTSYDVAMADAQYITNLQWKYLVVDEGHRIKNAQCRLIKALSLYDSTYRLLLTGTPLQNNLSELWSLLNFLLPEVFDDLDSFEFWFKLDCLKKDQQNELIAEEKKRNVLAMLHRIMTPFILRRLKSDVELDLPPKREVVVYAPLSALQREYYKSVVDRSIEALFHKDSKQQNETTPIPSPEPEDGPRRSRRVSQQVNYAAQLAEPDDSDSEEDIENWIRQVIGQTEARTSLSKKTLSKRTKAIKLKMTNVMMILRKVCSHPYLINQPLDENEHCVIDEKLVQSSGKMALLDIMLKELHTRGHKVLIFSQMTSVLDLVEDFMYLRQYNYCRLDGSTHLADRRQQMDDFNTDPEIFVFLLSTRAGGLGINLMAADTVILIDSDWNPQADLQAQDRAHRIGQTKPVVVYRFVVRDTIDERMVERAQRKRTLEKLIIHKERFKTGITSESENINKPITPAELLELLRSHDHEKLAEADDQEIISKRELNAILDRSDLLKQHKKNQAAKTLASTPGGDKSKRKKRRAK